MTFTVQMVSPCGVRYDLYCGLTEWEANDICQRNNWQYFDEYGTEWLLDYVEDHELKYDDEDDSYIDDSDEVYEEIEGRTYDINEMHEKVWQKIIETYEEDDPHGTEKMRERIKSITDAFNKRRDELEGITVGLYELFNIFEKIKKIDSTLATLENLKEMHEKVQKRNAKLREMKKMQLVHPSFMAAKQSTNKEEYRKEFFVYMQREDC